MLENYVGISHHLKRDELSVEQNCLFWGMRIIIPSCLRGQLLDDFHASHLGIGKNQGVGEVIRVVARYRCRHREPYQIVQNMRRKLAKKALAKNTLRFFRPIPRRHVLDNSRFLLEMAGSREFSSEHES